MVVGAQKKSTLEECYQLASDLLKSGKALDKFKELCEIHGGDLSRLPQPSQKKIITAEQNGFVYEMNTEKIGIAGILIQAGRAEVKDVINPVSGVEFHVKIGDPIQVGQPVFTVYGDQAQDLQPALTMLESAYRVQQLPIKKTELILTTIYGVNNGH